MSSDQPSWIWDADRRDYYYVTRNQYGQLIYNYRNAQAHQQQSQSLQQSPGYYGFTPIVSDTSRYATNHTPYPTAVQTQFSSNYSVVDVAQPPTAAGPHPIPDAFYVHRTAQHTIPSPQTATVDPQFRQTHQRVDSASHERPATIRGTPGTHERLDSSYRVRCGAEAYSFFVKGKVFAMLHIQAASASELAPLSDNITIVQYGERAFSQIRRFIVAEVRHGFVYACPITTYSGQGCLKKGCVPSEHSVVYVRGSSPTVFHGEREAGMTKDAICVVSAVSQDTLKSASRVHYSKSYPIEMNVKVKDIGDVAPEDLDRFIAYYNQENNIAPAAVSAGIAPRDHRDLTGIGGWR